MAFYPAIKSVKRTVIRICHYFKCGNVGELLRPHPSRFLKRKKIVRIRKRNTS